MPCPVPRVLEDVFGFTQLKQTNKFRLREIGERSLEPPVDVRLLLRLMLDGVRVLFMYRSHSVIRAFFYQFGQDVLHGIARVLIVVGLAQSSMASVEGQSA